MAGKNIQKYRYIELFPKKVYSFQIRKCLNLDNYIFTYTHKLLGCISENLRTLNYLSSAKEEPCVLSSVNQATWTW